MKSLSIHQKAVELRKKGYSYNMISQKLGLAKSTLSDWLKEIPYTPNKEVLKRIKTGPIKSGEARHNKKLAEILKTKQLAKRELGKLSKRDLWLLGIGLYWGEGQKSCNEGIGIMNSNPELIKTMIKWFKEICGLSTENFSITVHAYPDTNIKKTINYWSKITDIPKSQFKKPQIDRRTNKLRIKKGKLPYGTVKFRIKSNGKKEFGVFLFRKIIGWIEASLKQINKNMRV